MGNTPFTDTSLSAAVLDARLNAAIEDQPYLVVACRSLFGLRTRFTSIPAAAWMGEPIAYRTDLAMVL